LPPFRAVFGAFSLSLLYYTPETSEYQGQKQEKIKNFLKFSEKNRFQDPDRPKNPRRTAPDQRSKPGELNKTREKTRIPGGYYI